MIEVDEQGFVRDIKAAIDAINQENKSLREKVKEIIELPYGTQHEVEIENYINSFIAYNRFSWRLFHRKKYDKGK